MTNALQASSNVVTLTNANQEYTFTIPSGCAYLSIQARTAADVRFAFATGKVAGSTDPYTTLKSGMAYNTPERAVFSPGQTLYLATGTAGTVVEIVAYTQIM